MAEQSPQWMGKLRYLLYEDQIVERDACNLGDQKGMLFQSKPEKDGFSRNPYIAKMQEWERIFAHRRHPMLARYKIYRGKRPNEDPLPTGTRQDTQYRTHHPLAPTQAMVEMYLNAPSDDAWQTFAAEYLALIEERFNRDRAQFDQLAKLAAEHEVFLGCSCPTQKNPRVDHCHTWLALQFMKLKYPQLGVRFAG